MSERLERKCHRVWTTVYAIDVGSYVPDKAVSKKCPDGVTRLGLYVKWRADKEGEVGWETCYIASGVTLLDSKARPAT